LSGYEIILESPVMDFNHRLLDVIDKKNSLLCIGLDTALDKIPESLKQHHDPLFTFNKAIIDATADFAAACKVNTAFYEACGLDGWRALAETFSYLPSDVIKIADAKRGDIGNTSAMYARAFFKEMRADAITVNPLLGGDSVEPFLQDPQKGVFFLCLTSNPGSRDLQYFSNGQQSLFEKIISLVKAWNKNNNCGLVVGATHPQELAQVREMASNLPLLIPGIGAQGGDIDAAVARGTDANASNALFNSSRAIIYASQGDDFAQAARDAAEETWKKLNAARSLKRQTTDH
jgi:orotidine-5'-phosphate decarboxylase